MSPELVPSLVKVWAKSSIASVLVKLDEPLAALSFISLYILLTSIIEAR